MTHVKTPRDQYDVAVVGASLAGCTTATLLGRAGLRVALIDKHSGPDAYKRLCGHYIQASARPVIEQLGLAEQIETAGGVRNGVDMWTRWGVIAPPEAPERRDYGYSIRRSKLDPMVRRLATGTAGVDYLPGLEAAGLLGDGGTVAGVELRDRGRRERRIRTRLVVGADGRNSAVARLTGVRERSKPNERFCYMAYFTGVGLRGDLTGRFWSLDPDVAIAARNDDGITLLAAFLHKRQLGEWGGDRSRALLDLFRALPEAPDLAHAEPAGKVVGYTDYGIVARDPAPRPGVALVGDAALTCDPVMAIGCGWALQSAAWLADELSPALANGEPLGAAGRSYRRRHRRALMGHHRMLSSDARAREMNPVQRLVFAAAAQDPQLASRLHRYAQRSIPPSELLAPRALAQAATVVLARRGRSRIDQPLPRQVPHRH
jgi:2-polyprenyl-6-methoxyphenol hydroxylase-like FAD-dependent oxidoreductase